MLTSFVFSANENKISSGIIVQILGESEIIEKRGQQLIETFQTLSFKGINDGALIIYDINYKYLDGKSIRDGRVSRDQGAQLTKSGSNPLANSIISNGAKITLGNDDLVATNVIPTLSSAQNPVTTLSVQGEQNCIDWYWTTWNVNTGQIISQVYQYTTCQPATGGSGSTSSANLSKPQPCASSFHFKVKISGSTTDPNTKEGGR